MKTLSKSTPVMSERHRKLAEWTLAVIAGAVFLVVIALTSSDSDETDLGYVGGGAIHQNQTLSDARQADKPA